VHKFKITSVENMIKTILITAIVSRGGVIVFGTMIKMLMKKMAKK
jgi:hypothetical protein